MQLLLYLTRCSPLCKESTVSDRTPLHWLSFHPLAPKMRCREDWPNKTAPPTYAYI